MTCSDDIREWIMAMPPGTWFSSTDFPGYRELTKSQRCTLFDVLHRMEDYRFVRKVSDTVNRGRNTVPAVWERLGDWEVVE